MALPALRQPKIVLSKKSLPPEQYVMVTLKGAQKLVVSSDSYNGIVSMGDKYKCVFCDTMLDLNQSMKDIHVGSVFHKQMLERNPHVDEFSQNLIRTQTIDSKYCTICNVIVANIRLMNHISSEVHHQMLERATIRALSYIPHE